MEQQIRSQFEHTLNLSSNGTNKSLILHALASIRSLIINPSTSEPTISAIFETLTRYLQLSHDPLVLRHVLKILSDLAFHRTHFAQLVFKSVRANASLFTDSTRLAAESISVLVALAELDQTLVPAMDEFGDSFYASLCFRPSVSVRSWLLSNFDRFRIRPYLLLTLLLGFTKDPYPYVRRVALDGLVKLGKSIVCDDRVVIEGCYCRAVELLQDMESCVRSAAVRAVSEWGLMLVASNQDGEKKGFSDVLFVQLSSMVRDMSMEVRIEAFDALGKIERVSDDILQQSLSKKVLGITKAKNSLDQCTLEQLGISAADGAGAFVHGLEDEFYEVRRCACRSMHIFTVLSAEFAGGVINFLMYMLNDESLVVRLEALETMHQIAMSKRLKMQEAYMLMFLGTLVDNDSSVRSAARKVIRLMTLPNLNMFRSSLDGLIKNLEIYPQDEADVFSILFEIGQRHGNFTTSIIKKFHQEMGPSHDGRLHFNSARVAALIVLAISAPLSHDQHVLSIPCEVYSYAVAQLGRISRALSDVTDKTTLLTYLSQCYRSASSALQVEKEESFLNAIKGGISNCASIEICSPNGVSLGQICTGPSEIQSRIMSDLREDMHTDVSKYIRHILAKIEEIWPSIQSGCLVEVLQTVRTFKEELTGFTFDTFESAAALAFTLQYLRVIKLLAKVWIHFLPKRKLHYNEMGELDLILEKLDRRLTELRYRFLGLSEEEELHVLELVLLSCILRMSQVGVCCHHATWKKLCATTSCVKLLHWKRSVEPSNLFIGLEKLLCEVGTSGGGASCNPLLFKNLLQLFSLKHFVVSGSLKHLKAELEVPGNDYINPLTFVSGLPVGIPCKITLYNILSKNRLWLRIVLDEVKTQFVYLDLTQFGGSDEVRNFTCLVPFYNTPKAFSFILRVSIGMECLFEEVHMAKGCRGPKHELTYLCQDVKVYLSKTSNDR